jgi:hypothetical protein
LQIPKAPTHMEWFEEPNLARAFYEIIQVENDYELLKQSMSLKTDFNMTDLYTLFNP